MFSLADGKLTIQETFNLGTLPLGPGEIQNISLDMGGSIDLPSLNASTTWLASARPMPRCIGLSTRCPAPGACRPAFRMADSRSWCKLGIGLGLAIDLAIASGSASIVIKLSRCRSPAQILS